MSSACQALDSVSDNEAGSSRHALSERNVKINNRLKCAFYYCMGHMLELMFICACILSR